MIQNFLTVFLCVIVATLIVFPNVVRLKPIRKFRKMILNYFKKV